MAQPLRRVRCDDLLARGEEIDVYLLAAEELFLLRSRCRDRRRTAPRYRGRDRGELRRYPWRFDRGIRLHRAPRVQALVPVEEHRLHPSLPGREREHLFGDHPGPEPGHQLGHHCPAVRPNGQVRHGIAPGHRRIRDNPAPLHPWRAKSTPPTRPSRN